MVQSGVTAKALAAEIKRDQQAVMSWLAGTDRPHGGDLKRAALVLGRSPQFFRLPKPPDLKTSSVNRRAALIDSEGATPQELMSVRQTARLQTISRFSADALNLSPPQLPTPTESASDYAKVVRQWLDWDIVSDQIKATSKGRVFRNLRRSVEAAGIIVFLQNIGDDNSRGYSIPDDLVPTIFVNSGFTLASVRSYTLLHELAHLGRGDAALHHERSKNVERWCEKFAASFLLPADSLEEYLQKGVVSKTAPDELRRIRLISNRYGASWESVAIRLEELGLAATGLRDKVLEKEPKDTGFATPDSPSRTTEVRRLDEYGGEFTRLVLSAVQVKKLSNLDAHKYLRVSEQQLESMAALIGVGA